MRRNTSPDLVIFRTHRFALSDASDLIGVKRY